MVMMPRYSGGMKDSAKTPLQRQEEAIERASKSKGFRGPDYYRPKEGRKTNVGDPNHKR